jgi:mRNA interferase YafQ
VREIIPTTQFRRDAKRIQKRGQDLGELREIARLLAAGEPLGPKQRDHKLSGRYVGYRECHVRPDWLLIYKLTDEELLLVRTGTHQDLFDE